MSYLENVRKLLEYHGEAKREVYLDLENSAPVPNEVLNEMLPYFNYKAYGNPTLTHKQGWEAYEVIMEAADNIAKSIGASPEELCFTSGEAEANNTAILGSVLEKKGKIITSTIDPLTILLPIEILEKRGFEVVKVSVDSEGFINLDEFSKAIDKNTVLVSTSIINNEIGTIEPFKEIVEIAKDKNPEMIVHMDASDAYGRVMF
ncbi:MAG: aminotransferase class V-fold PLP-dependent enzyme, partial [Thermoproteota archaeon]